MAENNCFINFGNGAQIGNLNGGLVINMGNATQIGKVISDSCKNISKAIKFTDAEDLCEHCIHADIKGPGTYIFGNCTMTVDNKMVSCKLKSHSINIIGDNISCSGFEQK